MTKKKIQKRRKKTKFWNYPRAGKGSVHRWIPSWRFTVISTFTLFLTGCATILGMYFSLGIPEPDELALAQKTTVYYNDGKTGMGDIYEYDRTPVQLDTLPKYIGESVIASEDRTFYTNSGVDFAGIVRAAWNNIRGGARQGASTLTQQYVENYYLGKTRGYLDKLKEALLAIKVDRNMGKNEILQDYLNTIYYGRGAYGIESAAIRYFGKHASEIDLNQAALLTAVIPAPSSWDPAVNPKKAKERFNRVIKLMREDGYITDEDVKKATMPQTLPPSKGNQEQYRGPKGYLLDQAQRELIATGKFTEDTLRQGGYRITTTIDPTLQKYAEEAIGTLPTSRPANNYVGLLSADPRTGEIYAMYGGADYLARQRNSATQDHAQAGSTFKVFGALAALEQGKGIYTTKYDNTSPVRVGGMSFQNYGNYSYRPSDMYVATRDSLNTYYIQLNRDVKPRNTKAAAIQAGIPENTPGLDDGLSNVLGSSSPRNVDMTRAYATFASRGIKHDIHIVKEVRDSSGNIVYSADTKGKRAIDEKVADNMNLLLGAVTGSEGTASVAGRLGFDVSGKTGTSSGPVSAWFAGYTPEMVTVVNMYQIGANGEEEVLTGFGRHARTMTGGDYPAEVWVAYMKKASKDVKMSKFEKVETPIGGKPTFAPRPTGAPQTEGENPENGQNNDSGQQSQPAGPQPPQPAGPAQPPQPAQPAQPAQPGQPGQR